MEILQFISQRNKRPCCGGRNSSVCRLRLEVTLVRRGGRFHSPVYLSHVANPVQVHLCLFLVLDSTKQWHSRWGLILSEIITVNGYNCVSNTIAPQITIALSTCLTTYSEIVYFFVDCDSGVLFLVHWSLPLGVLEVVLEVVTLPSICILHEKFPSRIGWS